MSDENVPGGEAAGGPLDPRVTASLHDLRRSSPAGAAGIRDLVTTFLVDSEARVDQLTAAAAAGGGHTEALRGYAHSLAGSSASLGARQVAALCREVEARCIAGEIEDVPALVAQLEGAFAAARGAMRAEFLDGCGENS